MHVAGKQYVVNVRLSDLERQLAEAHFLRIHRSHLINLEHVAAIEVVPQSFQGGDLGQVTVNRLPTVIDLDQVGPARPGHQQGQAEHHDH